MSNYTCPLCGVTFKVADRGKEWAEKNPCRADPDADMDFVELYCHHFNFRFFLHNNLYYMAEGEQRERLLNLVTEHLNHSRLCVIEGATRMWYFSYNTSENVAESNRPNYVNLANQLNNYPIQMIDVAHRTLINYSFQYPHYGDAIYPDSRDKRLSFEHQRKNNVDFGVINLLDDLGYVKADEAFARHVITAAGWQKIDELRKQEQIVQQGFIAMSFREETRPIREAFRTAMKESGYSAAVIDEKEHNNQIVPEIFYEIARSKFVVVDVTYPNYGAYYEAGYAQALGKQVIICCREEEFHDKSTRPHFDISQKSMVVWKDEADLVQRLKRRIEATVK